MPVKALAWSVASLAFKALLRTSENSVIANFAEIVKGEVRRSYLPGTRVNKASLASFTEFAPLGEQTLSQKELQGIVNLGRAPRSAKEYGEVRIKSLKKRRKSPSRHEETRR